jgi:hypothetical protein
MKRNELNIQKRSDYQRVKNVIESVSRECEKPQRIRFAEEMEREINYLKPEDLLKRMKI